MGAWGADPFDNDDAADWAAEFDGADVATGVSMLRRALSAANSSEYIEAPDGALGVAAAQVVSWLLDPDAVRSTPYSDAVARWVTPGVAVDSDLLEAARRAVSRVQGRDSELAELWSESDPSDWKAVLDQIASNLARSAE